MPSRRARRRAEKHRRHPEPPAGLEPPQRLVVREAKQVERLTYNRTQAAHALGVSRSTFDRRVLPHIETIETPWGTKLVPADELNRLLADWREPARPTRKPKPPGRPRTVAPEVAQQIRDAHDAGLSLRQIAERLNTSGTPTTHCGKRWWASTIRSVLAH
jgi:hypothetical protein